MITDEWSARRATVVCPTGWRLSARAWRLGHLVHDRLEQLALGKIQCYTGLGHIGWHEVHHLIRFYQLQWYVVIHVHRQDRLVRFRLKAQAWPVVSLTSLSWDWEATFPEASAFENWFKLISNRIMLALWLSMRYKLIAFNSAKHFGESILSEIKEMRTDSSST